MSAADMGSGTTTGGGVRHAFTKALYECDADGNIIVTDGSRRGVFDRYGRWKSGELREADPHLCGWVAGEHYGSVRVVNDGATS